jgi:peptide/nickel transport system permease protein
MTGYVLRRSAYALLILLGVLAVTFLLFRVAAGDPAAVLLGKNPTPREVEDLRTALAADRPLLWGHWRRTELYPGATFDAERNLPGMTLAGDSEFRDGALHLRHGRLVLQRQFEPQGEYRLVLRWRGAMSRTPYGSFVADRWQTLVIPLKGAEIKPEFVLEIPSHAEFRSIRCERRQDSPWDSQMMAALGELVSFSTTFPHVRFLDFGQTLLTREPIRTVLWRGAGPSLLLMLPVFLGEILIGIALALAATAWQGRLPDRLIMVVSVAGMSVSYLVFIIAGQWFLAYRWNLFPVWGYGSARHLALPILVGIASGLGGGVRFYRTVFVDELNREYLRTARAKGCTPLRIYGHHLLRNAAIPVITRASATLPFLFTGSLLLESYFGIPGLGFLGYNALMNADLQTVKALVVVTAGLFILMNLATDIAYAWADPRVRLR